MRAVMRRVARASRRFVVDSGRPIAEFQGFSRSIGGPYVETGDED